MPTYEYECTACGHRSEVVQRFTDEPLTVCDECSGALRKVFSSVGVVFKGSGFYKTDSRGAASGSKPAATPAPTTDSTPSEKSTKPAPATSTSSTASDS